MSDPVPRYWRALACPCGRCGGYPEDEAQLRETARWLEEVEAVLGGDPLLIPSGGGWRCPEFAAECDEGFPGPDDHAQGWAADVVLRFHSPAHVQRHLVRQLGRLLSGIASLPGCTHITRPPAEPLRWRP